ncbi:MAG: NAD(P)H-dependent oxidoreductase [Gammaproteobacteria bacterium]|nr:NAD(P)H-dependent oxidoreductase [Gammaproteobacteria bacterium]MBU2477828.1 NAD(P)H-dependent oxidoreductase [Gammaproteobacteria bacterium]
MNIIQALNWRYAVRQFADEKLDEALVRALLTATRLSATAYGLQPYRLLVINDIDVRKQLLPYAMSQNKVVACSHLIVIAAQTQIDDTLIDRYIQAVANTRHQSTDDFAGLANHMKDVFAGKNEQQKKEWAHQQAYIALGTLLTSAAVMKIDACPMTGFETEGFDRVLGLNERGLSSTVICALGKRHPKDRHAWLPKVRYDHMEMVIEV